MVLADGANFCAPDNAIFCYMYMHAVNKKGKYGFVLKHLNLTIINSYIIKIIPSFCVENLDTIEGESFYYCK